MTLEQFLLVMNIAHNLEGMRNDMRLNAEHYKTSINNGMDINEIQSLMIADNAQYQRRLRWVKDLYDNYNVQLQNALSALNITLTSTIENYQELKNCADATDMADLSTGELIVSRSDAILSEIVPHLRLWI